MKLKILIAVALIVTTLLFHLSASANSNPTSVIQEACEHVNAITSIEMPFANASCKMTRASYEAEWTNFDAECTSNQSKMILKNCNVKYEIDKPKIKTIYQTCPTLKQLQAKCNQGVCSYEFPELGIDKAAFDKKESAGKLKFSQARFVINSNSKNTLEGALAECEYKFASGGKVVVVGQWWPAFYLKKESLPILAKLPFPLKSWRPTGHPLHEGTEEYVCSGNNTNKCQFELLKK